MFSLATIIILVLLVLKFDMSCVLDILNIKNVKKNSGAVPKDFESFMDLESYKKSTSYTIEKLKFGMFENFYNLIILSLVLIFWVLPYLFDYFAGLFGFAIWAQALSIIMIMLLLSLPEIPMELYMQFKIEEKYGFNKSTLALWISDKVKGFFVGLVLGTPILMLILLFSETFSKTWWLWAFFVVAIFQLVMIVIYPQFIVPLFNKLTPLPDGELKDALFDMADHAGFKTQTIQVIDGSKRSSHSNAYFTGFGKFRRIVLFDTLIEQLSVQELQSVLAHEIGHYRKGHILKMIAVAFTGLFLSFAAMGYLSNSQWFYTQLGFTQAQGFGPVLMILSMYSGVITFWFAPIMNLFSRKNEYEADNFAAQVCGTSQHLISALKKLHKKNLGNLTPHPLYSAFYYSHPSLMERLNALEELEK